VPETGIVKINALEQFQKEPTENFQNYNDSSIVRWQGPISVQYRPYKVLLLFLYLRGVLFKNLNDATLSSLGNPPNMQI